MLLTSLTILLVWVKTQYICDKIHFAILFCVLVLLGEVVLKGDWLIMDQVARSMGHIPKYNVITISKFEGGNQIARCFYLLLARID